MCSINTLREDQIFVEFHPHIVVAATHQSGKHICFSVDHSLARLCQTNRVVSEPLELVADGERNRVHFGIERNETSDDCGVISLIRMIVDDAIAKLKCTAQHLEAFV